MHIKDMDGAFLIGGHGGEPSDTFIVPPGCIILVHVYDSETIYRKTHIDYLKKLLLLKKDVLHNPIEVKHLPIILNIYKRMAIYREGDTCPNFKYVLFDCLNSTMCYDTPMGVIDLDIDEQTNFSKKMWRYHLGYNEFDYALPNSATHQEIIEYFSKPYEYSIYPTKNSVEAKIQEIIDQNPPSLLRAIYKGLEKYTTTTQSDLCDFRKGVYYHSVCRQKKYVTRMLSSSINSIPQIKRNITHVIRSYGSKANKYVSHKTKILETLKHRIGETVKYRSPFIKQWMSSPLYQEKQRNSVTLKKKTLRSSIMSLMLTKRMIEKNIEKEKKKLKYNENTFKKKIDKLQNTTKKIYKLQKNYNNYNDLEKSLTHANTNANA